MAEDDTTGTVFSFSSQPHDDSWVVIIMDDSCFVLLSVEGSTDDGAGSITSIEFIVLLWWHGEKRKDGGVGLVPTCDIELDIVSSCCQAKFVRSRQVQPKK